jgi:hypothetical protein
MTLFLLSIGTAVWFGAMAFRAGRNCIAWALGGALFALVAATLILGVFHATFLPMSHEAYVKFRVESLAIACLVILAVGWLLTSSLHRHPQVLWRWLVRLFRRPA